MTEHVVLDSSVLVSSFVAGDAFRPVAREVMRRVFRGAYSAIESNVVPPEVIGAISRKAGVANARKARARIEKWEELGLFGFVELDRRRRLEAGELALNLRLRGMDSIIIQLAREKRAVLITFDEEMASKAKSVVKVLTAEDIEMKV